MGPSICQMSIFPEHTRERRPETALFTPFTWKVFSDFRLLAAKQSTSCDRYRIHLRTDVFLPSGRYFTSSEEAGLEDEDDEGNGQNSSFDTVS